jgi:hypothetical protein
MLDGSNSIKRTDALKGMEPPNFILCFDLRFECPEKKNTLQAVTNRGHPAVNVQNDRWQFRIVGAVIEGLSCL